MSDPIEVLRLIGIVGMRCPESQNLRLAPASLTLIFGGIFILGAIKLLNYMFDRRDLSFYVGVFGGFILFSTGLLLILGCFMPSPPPIFGFGLMAQRGQAPASTGSKLTLHNRQLATRDPGLTPGIISKGHSQISDCNGGQSSKQSVAGVEPFDSPTERAANSNNKLFGAAISAVGAFGMTWGFGIVGYFRRPLAILIGVAIMLGGLWFFVHGLDRMIS